jgi:DsbC/DsbD-like thiol-disulfide interchange protein
MRIAKRGLPIALVLAAGLLLTACGPKRPAEDSPRTQHAKLDLLIHGPLPDPNVDCYYCPLFLGVHFVMEPGWHIYWQNPGDSGQPPVITWKLPPGFSAGEIQWPRPQRLNSTGASLMDYGYKDEVLLLVPLKTPARVTQDAIAQASVKYLICREVCLPEKAELRLRLSNPQHSTEADDALYVETVKQLPIDWPAQWKTDALSRKDDFVLTIVAGTPIRKADFFPLDADVIENAAPQQLHPTTRGATIMLKRSDQLLKPVAELRGVLVIPGEGSYRVDIPVTQR